MTANPQLKTCLQSSNDYKLKVNLRSENAKMKRPVLGIKELW